jgi:hypothetical protein
MKRWFGFLLFLLLPASILLLTAAAAYSQSPTDRSSRKDSSFSLLINTGLSFTHANDPHINRWLEKYGYPTEPHVPTSFNFEFAAIPASSRLLYSIKLSAINSGRNLTSFKFGAGLYTSLFKTRSFLLFVGAATGYHSDIIRLNGNLPPEYQQLAARYPFPLALRRTGLFLDPGVRAFWYPISFHSLQLGLYGGLSYDFDFNSHWHLGYYSNNHGKTGSHFKQLNKPADQMKVSEHGICLSSGLSVRIHLH